MISTMCILPDHVQTMIYTLTLSDGMEMRMMFTMLLAVIFIFQVNQPENIHPVSMVDNSDSGIVGSCATYDTRIDITETVRGVEGAAPCSLKDIEERRVVVYVMCSQVTVLSRYIAS